MMKMTVGNHELNFSIKNDGRCLPRSYEILEQVGLESIAKKIDKFYELLGYAEPNDFFKWVAYTSDSTVFQAKARVTKYLLLDGGCRMCAGMTEKIRNNEFNWLRNQLSMLEVQHFYTFDEVAKILNETGFQITLTKD
jgi:hypothetical protein